VSDETLGPSSFASCLRASRAEALSDLPQAHAGTGGAHCGADEMLPGVQIAGRGVAGVRERTAMTHHTFFECFLQAVAVMGIFLVIAVACLLIGFAVHMVEEKMKSAHFPKWAILSTAYGLLATIFFVVMTTLCYVIQ
jgi:hypothetical protein